MYPSFPGRVYFFVFIITGLPFFGEAFAYLYAPSFGFQYCLIRPLFPRGPFLYIRGMKELTRNEAVEMMLVNNTSAFRLVAGFIERYEMDWKEASDYLRECAGEMEAQSVVVRMRDELGFSKPVY